MANPTVTAEPKKTINGFESRWNAAALPIVFTINNDKYPTGESVTNYRTEIDVYVDGALVGTIEQVPDSSNNTVVDVRKYVQTGLTLKPSGGVNDTNASCEFYIIAREKYTDVYGNDKEHGADGDSEIFYATLSALQFGNARGGNMYDYVVDQDKSDTASFMTFFTRGQLLDTTTYYLNIILNESPVDLDVNQYDINGNLLQNDLLAIADQGIGLYRMTLDSIDFDDSVNYITVEVWSKYYGEVLSELFNIDVDLACAETVAAATALNAATISDTQIDLSWTDNTDGAATYKILRGTESGNLSEIDSGVTGTSYSDTTPNNSLEYFYAVQAVLNGITSDQSSESSAMTWGVMTFDTTWNDSSAADGAFSIVWGTKSAKSNVSWYVDDVLYSTADDLSIPADDGTLTGSGNEIKLITPSLSDTKQISLNSLKISSLSLRGLNGADVNNANTPWRLNSNDITSEIEFIGEVTINGTTDATNGNDMNWDSFDTTGLTTLDLSKVNYTGKSCSLENTKFSTFIGFKSATIRSQLGLTQQRPNFGNNPNVTSYDFSTVDMLGNTGFWTIDACTSLTSITFKQQTDPSVGGLTRLDMFGNTSLGFVSFAQEIMNFGSLSEIKAYNNLWSTAIVNQTLVECATWATSRSATGGTINVGGTNYAPDGSTGGYDGTQAVTDLTNLGVTVITS